MLPVSLNSLLNQTGSLYSQDNFTVSLNSHTGNPHIIAADTLATFPGRSIENTGMGVFKCKELLLWVHPAAGDSIFNWQVFAWLLKKETQKDYFG